MTLKIIHAIFAIYGFHIYRLIVKKSICWIRLGDNTDDVMTTQMSSLTFSSLQDAGGTIYSHVCTS